MVRVLCDGANGTPDCRDYFVEIAATGNEGNHDGDNTALATATTNSAGSHSHKGSSQGGATSRAMAHESSVSHNHTISASAPIDPPYYALAFIMFSPGA